MKKKQQDKVVKLCVSLPKAVVRFAKTHGKISPAIAAAVMQSPPFKKWSKKNAD